MVYNYITSKELKKKWMGFNRDRKELGLERTGYGNWLRNYYIPNHKNVMLPYFRDDIQYIGDIFESQETSLSQKENRRILGKLNK